MWANRGVVRRAGCESVGPKVGLSSLGAVEGAPSRHGSRCTRTAWKTSGPASRIAPPRLVFPLRTAYCALRGPQA